MTTHLGLPLAVRLRDEAGPRLPQMVAQRRAQLANEIESRLRDEALRKEQAEQQQDGK